MCKLPNKKSGKIKFKNKESIKKYWIDIKNIYSATVDNGSNIVKAADYKRWEQMIDKISEESDSK